MITNHLYRQPSHNDGTFGIFVMPAHSWCCHSLERRWANNAVFVSCIPLGEYICKWTESRTFKRETYQVMNVDSRTGIRIHPGNWFTDSAGCIMFGRGVEYINGLKQLIDSKDAVEEFELLMNKNPFKLVIQ